MEWVCELDSGIKVSYTWLKSNVCPFILLLGQRIFVVNVVFVSSPTSSPSSSSSLLTCHDDADSIVAHKWRSPNEPRPEGLAFGGCYCCCCCRCRFSTGQANSESQEWRANELAQRRRRRLLRPDELAAAAASCCETDRHREKNLQTTTTTSCNSRPLTAGRSLWQFHSRRFELANGNRHQLIITLAGCRRATALGGGGAGGGAHLPACCCCLQCDRSPWTPSARCACWRKALLFAFNSIAPLLLQLLCTCRLLYMLSIASSSFPSCSIHCTSFLSPFFSILSLYHTNFPTFVQHNARHINHHHHHHHHCSSRHRLPAINANYATQQQCSESFGRRSDSSHCHKGHAISHLARSLSLAFSTVGSGCGSGGCCGCGCAKCCNMFFSLFVFIIIAIKVN